MEELMGTRTLPDLTREVLVPRAELDWCWEDVVSARRMAESAVRGGTMALPASEAPKCVFGGSIVIDGVGPDV
jgi:hypothetical protein